VAGVDDRRFVTDDQAGRAVDDRSVGVLLDEVARSEGASRSAVARSAVASIAMTIPLSLVARKRDPCSAVPLGLATLRRMSADMAVAA
jgi:hypothetical protein